MIGEDIIQIREDMAYIKARIEALPDHEIRLRSLERFRYAVPGSTVVALVVSGLGLALTIYN